MPTLQTGILNNRSGFTLVELLVVIVVLSLISLISLPLFDNWGEGAERLKVRRLAGTVKQLYNEATLTQDEHQLRFDFSDNSMAAFRMRANDRTVEKEPFGREISLAPLVVQQIDIVGKGRFSSGQVTIRIFPLGWMEATTIMFAKESGEKIELKFSPLTGSVTIDAKQTSGQ